MWLEKVYRSSRRDELLDEGSGELLEEIEVSYEIVQNNGYEELRQSSKKLL